MKKYTYEDIEFEEFDVLEFYGDTFKIVYDEKCIYVESLDPEIEDNIIILEGIYEGHEYIFDTNSIKLYDDFILTKEKFNEIKEFIKKEKESKN